MGGGGAKVVVLLTSGLAGAAAASMVLMPARAKRDLGLGAEWRETRDRQVGNQAGRKRGMGGRQHGVYSGSYLSLVP